MKFFWILLFSISAYSYDAEKYDRYETTLTQLEVEYGSAVDPKEQYQASLKIWREIVDATNDQFSREEGETDEEFQKGFDRHLDLLLRSSKIRSQYLIQVEQSETSTVFELDLAFFNDLKREITLVPIEWYAIAYFKLLYVKNNLKLGFDGVKTLVIDAFILLIVFMIPFFFWRVTNRILKKLKVWRANFIRQSYRQKNYSLYAELLRLAIDYLPWLVALYSISLSRDLLEKSHFEELSIFYPFITYWIYYRIFRKIISDSLLRIARNHRSPSGDQTIEEKAANNASLLSLTVLVSYSLIYIIESVVSKGLSYYIFQYLSFAVVLFVLFIIGRDWREELSVKIADMDIPFVSTWLAERLKKKKHFYLCLPVLISVLTFNVFMLFLQWSGRFEFVKSITAEIFKRKLESSEIFEESELQDLPNDYQDLFYKTIESDKALFIESKKSQYNNIMLCIELWIQDKTEENSLFLVGEKGSGKTTLLTMLESELQRENIQIIRANMPSRLLSQAQLLKFLSNITGVEMEENYLPLIDADKEMSPTLIMLDESQNSFLSKIGGFEAFKTILGLINARLENIFFVFSFNAYSWSYLNAAFGKNQNFRNVIELEPFSDRDIRDMIMKRHNQSDYKLSFHDIVKATKGAFEMDSVEQVEEQFFRLLWEQSLGNPEISLYTWLSSLKYRGGKFFRVGLPHDDDLSMLSNFSDDTLFIYSAIVKHENLSTADAMKVTSLPEGVIRFAIKLGLDHNILIRRENGSYTVNVRFQHSLISYLKKKNLIYAS